MWTIGDFAASLGVAKAVSEALPLHNGASVHVGSEFELVQSLADAEAAQAHAAEKEAKLRTGKLVARVASVLSTGAKKLKTAQAATGAGLSQKLVANALKGEIGLCGAAKFYKSSRRAYSHRPSPRADVDGQASFRSSVPAIMLGLLAIVYSGCRPGPRVQYAGMAGHLTGHHKSGRALRSLLHLALLSTASGWVPPSPPPSCTASLSMSPATITLGDTITYTWSFAGHQPTHAHVSLSSGCAWNDAGPCKYAFSRDVAASESPYTVSTADWDVDPSVSWGPTWPTLTGYVQTAAESGRTRVCWDYASVALILPPPPSPTPPLPPTPLPSVPPSPSPEPPCQDIKNSTWCQEKLRLHQHKCNFLWMQTKCALTCGQCVAEPSPLAGPPPPPPSPPTPIKPPPAMHPPPRCADTQPTSWCEARTYKCDQPWYQSSCAVTCGQCVSPPPLPPPPPCQDTTSSTWCQKKTDKCDQPWFQRNCAKTCGQCDAGPMPPAGLASPMPPPPVPPPPCEDIKSSSWCERKKDKCEARLYLQRNCALTCGECVAEPSCPEILCMVWCEHGYETDGGCQLCSCLDASSPPPAGSPPPAPLCEDTKPTSWCEAREDKCDQPWFQRNCATTCGQCHAAS